MHAINRLVSANARYLCLCICVHMCGCEGCASVSVNMFTHTRFARVCTRLCTFNTHSLRSCVYAYARVARVCRMLFMFLCVCVNASLVEQFVSESHGERFGHYYFLLNGEQSVLLDTGSSVAWLVSSLAIEGGYPVGSNGVACNTQVSYGDGSFRTFNADVCVNSATVSFGKIVWQTDLSVSHGLVDWWMHAEGIIGASPRSDFARAFPVFTLSPLVGKSAYELHVGRKQPNHQCVFVDLTETGKRYGKWLISGRMRIGKREWVNSDFEVDTGYPAMSIPASLWDEAVAEVETRGGMLSGSRVGYSHTVNSCGSGTIPPIEYELQSSDETIFVRIPASAFSSAEKDHKCKVFVIQGQPDATYAYIGAPMLRHLTLRFETKNQRIGFCKN